MEQLNMTPELTPEDPAYIEEMAAKGEAAVQAGNTHRDPNAEAPAIPKKFMNEDGSVNVDALAKSYSELEKKMSQPKAQQNLEVNQEAPKEDKPTEEQPKQETPQVENEQQARELVSSKGIDFDALTQEYNTLGGLSPKSYEALAKAGIPQETVDAYVQGQFALAEKFQGEAMDMVGGREAYNEMADWARTNMTTGQLQAYNNAVSSRDPDVIKFAVGALKAQYESANGYSPKRQLMGSTNSSGETIKPFMSRTQYVDAIKDARYERDPAYRAEVVERLQRSDIF